MVLPAKGQDYFTEEINFSKGDRMFLYSDGVTEAINKGKEQFSIKRLGNVLNDTNFLKTSEIINFVSSALKKHTKTEDQADDITMMMVESS